jgi:hypothetical protein
MNKHDQLMVRTPSHERKNDFLFKYSSARVRTSSSSNASRIFPLTTQSDLEALFDEGLVISGPESEVTTRTRFDEPSTLPAHRLPSRVTGRKRFDGLYYPDNSESLSFQQLRLERNHHYVGLEVPYQMWIARPLL